MSHDSWVRGGSGASETGIDQVLGEYTNRGGTLMGACRWSQNPLTLTHVRWTGNNGEILEAYRRPDDDSGMGPDEREVWVDLAVDFSTLHASPAGPNPGWLPLPIPPEKAYELARKAQRSRLASRASTDPSTSAGRPSGMRYGAYSGPSAPLPTFGGRARNSGAVHFQQHDTPPYRSAQGQPFPAPDTFSAPPSSYVDEAAFTGGFQRGAFGSADVSVIPCVEVELPPVIMDPAAINYQREFAKDVATHFARAARSIPAVREVRGWMRDGRLVLAARVAVGSGMRSPSKQEMDDAVRLLEQMLAQRTIPYSKIGHADPGEWAQQGQTLPD